MEKHNNKNLPKEYRIAGYAKLQINLGDVSNGICLPLNPTENDDVLEVPISLFPSKAFLEKPTQDNYFSVELHLFMDCQRTQLEEEVSVFLTDFHKRKKRCTVGLRSRIHRGYKLFRELSLHNELDVKVYLSEKRLLVRSPLQDLPVLEHDRQRIRICTKEELYMRSWFPSKYEFSHNYGKGKGDQHGGVYITEGTAIEEASLHAEEDTELGKAKETISVYFLNGDGSEPTTDAGFFKIVFLISSQICRDGELPFHLRDIYFLNASWEREDGALCYKIGEKTIRRDEDGCSYLYWNNLCDAVIEEEKEAVRDIIIGRMAACAVSNEAATTVRGAEITD